MKVYGFRLRELHRHEKLNALQEVLNQFGSDCVLDMAQHVQKLADEIVEERNRRVQMFRAFESKLCSRKDLDDAMTHVLALEGQLGECRGKALEDFEQELRGQKRKRTAGCQLGTVSEE